MAYTGPASGSTSFNADYSGLRSEGREPGARRKKLAGYLKAANELRQSYMSGDGSHFGTQDGDQDVSDSAFSNPAVVRSGNEEMILFPSYARKHVKSKPRVEPGSIQQTPGTGRDYRDTSGAGDPEFWREQWDKYEDDNAIVDVDVRGWIYTPQKGATSRRQRLMVGLARQLSGIPAPSATKSSASSSRSNSRPSSPHRHEEEQAAREAEAIIRKGQAEADIAARGGFSEAPGRGDADSIYSAGSRQASPEPRSRQGSEDHRLTRVATNESLNSDIRASDKRGSWSAPSKMSRAELAVANAHLISRLKPFMAIPLANTPISAFFYNEKLSRQRTVNTDASGHFTLRAALEFVPTHVRLLASEKLSATEEVTITEPAGVSVISDIDDTIKHSGISAGAREIFRNAFIRDLSDLTIEGVKEWYQTLADMGVKLHYVSNSPWQLYPVITSFFKLAGLPRGSFHLKQYSGMLQGIFEPVAERKKGTLDRILRDFPERRFILIGDSGEADLEVYTDVVLDNPGRVLGIFIRDVTTHVRSGFFDASNGSHGGRGRHSRNHSRHMSADSLAISKRLLRPDDIKPDDDELKAAIAASMKDMEPPLIDFSDGPETTKLPGFRGENGRPNLPTRGKTEVAVQKPKFVQSPDEEDLIDFNSEQRPLSSKPWPLSEQSGPQRGAIPADPTGRSTQSPPPRLPSKPNKLRSPSPNMQALTEIKSDRNTGKSPPPKPRKPSNSVHTPPPPIQALSAQHNPSNPSPLAPVQRQEMASLSNDSRPPLPIRPTARLQPNHATTQPGSRGGGFWHGNGAVGAQPEERVGAAQFLRSMSSVSTKSVDDLKAGRRKIAPPPPPPPRRNLSSYPAAAARYASNRLSGTHDDSAYRPTDPGRDGGGGTTPGEQLSRKELMWRQRWARAKDIMDRNGVMLRSWRVGSDVADVCVKVAEQGIKDFEREQQEKWNKDGWERGRRSGRDGSDGS